MIRRLQITLLALFVSVWAMASETSVKNADGVEIWYNFDSNTKTASVTYRGDNYESYSDEYTGEVVIPSKVTYEGTEYSVTSIGDEAFRSCYSLTSITIPESVTEIGERAFQYCYYYLTSITIPKSVTEIGDFAFYYCGSLESITIPESVTEIGHGTFSNCSSLTSITIPKGVTEIGEGAFCACSSLTSITIPEGVTKIEDFAFYYCGSLVSITIPESVTSIGEYAFYDCSSLTSITLPESVTLIGDYAFQHCSSLTSITIPEGVTEIGEVAFSYCSSLASITLPESVTSIGDYAFSDCSGLTSVEFNAKNCTSMGSDSYPVFSGCTKLTNLTIGKNVTNIPSYAFYNCSGLTSVTIPEGVTEIGDSAFVFCYKLYEVYNKSNLIITAGSSENGYVAYYAKNVYTDESGESKLKIVGDYIFYVDEDNIELLAYIGDEIAITLPSDYEGKNYKIGNYAFYNCDALTSITIPEGVTEIGNSAFSDCSGLTSVEFNAKNCTSMGSDSYPVFSGCTELTNLTIGENVTNIPSYAFYNCSGLTSVTIPEGVTEIGDYAFGGCNGLTSVEFNAKNCTSMGSYGEPVFSGCTQLTNLTIGENVISIPFYAFKDCSGLTSVTIPESVTWIGWSAFYNCSGLTSITSMNAIPPYIGDSNMFYEVDKSIPVYVAKQSVEAYKSALYWNDFTNIVGKFLVVTATAENGTVTGAGVYEENEEVTLIATPDEGYKFVKWEDGETNATRKITVTEDVTLTAVFELNSSDSPVSDVVADSVSIRLIGNSLIVEGAESYAVYALSGQCLGKVESLERGLYIVVADGVSKRIVVK